MDVCSNKMPDPFTPPSSTLPPLSDYEPLTDIDWDSVRSLADEQGWVWDDSSGQYLDGESPVDTDDILQLTYAEIERIEGEISDISAQLENEDISLSEWEELLANITAATAALFFLLGIGSVGAITSDHNQHVKDRLTTQFEYLRKFSDRIAAGELSMTGLIANANLYPQDAQLHYSQAQEFIHSVDDWPFYSNVLGGCQHCSQCPEQTAQGIVERGSLIPIGARLCKWRCCCMWAYHKTRDGNDALGMPSFGWVGVKAGVKAPLVSRLSV
jgi:hypothetical protein